MDVIFKKAEHNPPHLFIPNAVYMLTASTYQKENIIHSSERKAEWRDAFLKAANLYHWRVIAWVILNNHYHALAESPENSISLTKFVGSYHKFTSRKWNKDDGISGRQVWWSYWDTCIRSEKDFYNRLKYIFWNPVKHELVEKPEDYQFSSYRDFLQSEETDFTGMDEVIDVPEF